MSGQSSNGAEDGQEARQEEMALTACNPLKLSSSKIFVAVNDLNRKSADAQPASAGENKAAGSDPSVLPFTVYCNCGETAKQLTCRKGNNAGRDFYSCSQRQRNPETNIFEGGCSFFKWASQVSATDTSSKKTERCQPPSPVETKIIKTRTLLQEAAQDHRYPWMVHFEKLLRNLPNTQDLVVERATPYMMSYYYVHLLSWKGKTQKNLRRYCLRDRTPITPGGPLAMDYFWILLHGADSGDNGWLYSPFVTHIVWPMPPESVRDDVDAWNTNQQPPVAYYLVNRQSLLRFVELQLLDNLDTEQRQPVNFEPSLYREYESQPPVGQVFKMKDTAFGYRRQILVHWDDLEQHCDAMILRVAADDKSGESEEEDLPRKRPKTCE